MATKSAHPAYTQNKTSSVLINHGPAEGTPYCWMLYSISAIDTQKQPKKKLSCGWCNDLLNDPLVKQNRAMIRAVNSTNRVRSKMAKILPITKIPSKV